MFLSRLRALVKRFTLAERANVAILFGLSSTALVVGLGSSIDLARGYAARQKLSHVAELTCQYSSRASVVDLANTTYGNSSGFPAYISAVNAYAARALVNQHWTGPAPAAPSGTYFTATASTSTTDNTASSTAPSNPVTELTAQVSTYFMQLIKISQLTVHAKVNCLTASTAPQIVTSAGPNSTTNYILREIFNEGCPAICATNPTGGGSLLQTPTSMTPSFAAYTGSYGASWYIIGYCLEFDTTAAIGQSASPQGQTTAAQLDCDNGYTTAGNSSASTKVYLAPGHYELRYDFVGTVDYPNYDPVYICGTTAGDVSWANDSSGFHGYPTYTNVTRTNQINAYLDMAVTNSIPMHTTLDGTQQLGGSNLIDGCVYSKGWIERSVKITITTPAYYWVTFAADGQNDGVGGDITNVRLCQDTCAGPLNDNFPTTWLAANNGGINKVLFEDGFESPVYTQDPYVSSDHAKGGNLANSYGTTVTTGCSYNGSNQNYASPPGWPCQPSIGWATAPYNEVVFWMQGATQGNQYFSLQGWTGFDSGSGGTDPINRTAAHSFLLDPGYYNVSYDYTSMVDFSYSNSYGVTCISAPSSGPVYYGLQNLTGYERFSSQINVNVSTNILGVFMANGQLVSTPNPTSTLGAAPTYTNPDGTTSSTPAVPFDSINWANYSATAVNPVIDTCGYSSGYAWVPRSVNVMITKPGWYWLGFTAQNDALTGTGNGPVIDDVKLTALGSLYMSGAPTTSLTTITVPSPQPNSDYYGLNSSYNGFYIVADPMMPPVADQ